MSNRGRSQVLNEETKARILAYYELGFRLAAVASKVNCPPNAIVNAGRRDPDFADDIRLAKERGANARLADMNVASGLPQDERASYMVLAQFARTLRILFALEERRDASSAEQFSPQR
jgi:hypothetical protein